jgi:thymidylate synthase (FAD)
MDRTSTSRKVTMPYITEPEVYLVTKTSVDWEQVAAFLQDEDVPPVPDSIRAGEDESAAVVEISARLCYMSYGKGRKDIADFVGNLLSKGDGSVFEHVNYGFVVTGVSRAMTHELVRHRAGFAYSQRSQRFVDESDSPFVEPPALSENREGTEEGRRIFADAIRSASSSYGRLVEALEKSLPKDMFPEWRDRRKAIRQAARAVLPNATETKIFVTANVRAWRHFIGMRGASYADWEIRRLALIILDLLQKEAPLLFGDFVVEDLPDGTQIATPKYPKV